MVEKNNEQQTDNTSKYKMRTRFFFLMTFFVLLLFVLFQIFGNFAYLKYRNPKNALEQKMDQRKIEEMTEKVRGAYNYETNDNPNCVVISNTFSNRNMEVSSVLETLEGGKISHLCLKQDQVDEMNFDELPDSLQCVIVCNDKEGMSLSQEQIMRLVEKKITIIYTQMPDAQAIEDQELQEVFGIEKLNGVLEQKGMRFTDDVFAGGILELDSIRYKLEDVDLEPSTKVFAYGSMENVKKDKTGETKNEDLPPLMWRNTYQGCKIYVVNGEFFVENKGYGLLTAIFSDMEEDYMYPVINASVMIYDSIPYVGSVDEELLDRLYSRNAERFQSDILLPDIISICKRLDIVPTFYTHADASMRHMNYFERSVLSLDGELVYKENADIVAKDISRPEGRIWDDYPSLPIIVAGYDKNDDDLNRLYSIGTTFGCVIHSVDIAQIVNPESDDYDWVKISKAYSKYIAFYQEDFGALDRLTATEASERYMEYLIEEPTIVHDGNKIHVKVDQMGKSASFVLRTDKEIKDITEGATYKRFGDNSYLIKTTVDDFTLTLKNQKNKTFHE